MAESEKFDWSQLEEAKKALVKRAEALKQSFVQMPGGAPADAGAGAAGGIPPDAAAAGVPPEMAGAGAPPGAMPPEMTGMPPDALAALAGGAPMGVDAATAGMLGGTPPADPAAAGAGGAMAGGAGAGAPEPTLTLTLSQLWDVVTKVLGLAKKIGANGQGVAAEQAPTSSAGGVNQDAIKAAVIEALGDMGAMR